MGVGRALAGLGGIYCLGIGDFLERWFDMDLGIKHWTIGRGVGIRLA